MTRIRVLNLALTSHIGIIKKILNCNLKNEIGDYVVKIVNGIGKIESKFTLDMIYGLLFSGEVMLSEIARSLNDKIKLDRTLKRLSVNLQDFKEEYIYQIKENILNSVKNKITNRGTIENGSSINNISVIFA